MRIIAGKAKGRKILSPATYETRPTLDRVKESMFSIIQNYLIDATVVDVFAGTGSLGLEAASRGAKEVFLVDKSPVTFPILKQNIENLKFDDFCHALNKDAYAALNFLADKNKVFDIIFIDPPYLKDMIPKALEIVKEKNMLHPEGIVVTKIDTSEEICDGYKDIKLVDTRKYGNTTVCLYKYKED
ncbi:16S rRNA (guanine(966)-N(2))-methyltransferase RsmD [Clostridium sp. 'White wine YQ']|uniref:16S rRNA (guanine(966)-N(2))-methyltransferase RsmD n=1 Tax=Clostridium sp. 'White wine YQ' TaxID=3027474 RepID=UPI002366D740|nr:16S rRNA (guanine(966)-N(2))-methyltransferase RsmD [Clostridium sp. 'White wine YQ']MDD7793753.1 16S rRNA (guanine(966)-N(2))-methyltransferase RsmD [Clostridium sp. 'White wine YQ']